MAHRPGSHRADHASPLVDLDVVFADDRLIDSITGVHPEPTDGADLAVRSMGRHSATMFGRGRNIVHSKQSEPAGTGFTGRPEDTDPLVELFQTWRQELASEPLPPLPSVHHASVAVDNGRAHRKRSVRSALSVAAAIAALLIGSATVGSKDAPQGSALWGITQVLWPERAVSVASRDHVRTAIDEATKALAAGDTQQAQLALLRAAVALGRVADVDGKGGMQEQVDNLWRVAAPRELSGTTLATDPLTGQMLADGQPAHPIASAAAAPASAVPQTLSSPAAAPPAVSSAAGDSVPTDRPSTGIVVPGPSRLAPAEPVVPTSAAPSRAASGAVGVGDGPAGSGAPSVPAAVAAPGVPSSGPSVSSARVVPASSVAVPEPSTAPQVPPAPATPTPPIAADPPSVEPPEGPSTTSTSTVGTTAPAPAPAPTTTGADPTETVPVTTTGPAATGTADPRPQPTANTSPAG